MYYVIVVLFLLTTPPLFVGCVTAPLGFGGFCYVIDELDLLCQPNSLSIIFDSLDKEETYIINNPETWLLQNVRRRTEKKIRINLWR